MSSSTKEEVMEDVDEGVLKTPDVPPYPNVSFPKVEEPDYEAAAGYKSQAREHEGKGEWEKAIEFYTKSLESNPSSTLNLARRAQCLIECERPNAAINDCNAALKANPDSSKAKKIRGHAYRLIGEYEKALKDLSDAMRYDFDPKTDKLRVEVQDRVKKLKAARRVKAQEAQEARRKKAEEEEEARKSQQQQSSGMPGTNGGMPNMGGIAQILTQMLGNDPEIKKYLDNPKVTEAFKKMLSNPMGAMNDPLMQDPEVKAAMEKIMPKLQSMMGGMMGGMGGFPGGMNMPGMNMPGMNMPGMGTNIPTSAPKEEESTVEIEEDEDDLD